MTQDLRRRLLQRLSGGEFHSGEELGQSLGMSRAAVWKYIQALQQDGLPIESLHGKGYRLNLRIELLDAAVIQAQLADDVRANIRLEIFDSLESINACLMRQKDPAGPRMRVCMAEQQTAGRGRRGRQWQSPYATSLALSVSWRFDNGAAGLAGLSLAVGVCVADVLKSLAFSGLRLKWPNDLLWQHYKIGGILIELTGDASGPCDCVIGIGLNVNNRGLIEHSGMQQIEQPWLDLASIADCGGQDRNGLRNVLAARLIENLYRRLPEFEAHGFAPFIDAYSAYDSLYGLPVMIDNGKEQLQGTADGVDNAGCLLLKNGNAVQTVRAGEVSVRLIPADARLV